MSTGHLTLSGALTQRLQLVQEISAAQSRSAHNRQLGGGAEFEIQQIEQEIAEAGSSGALAGALDDARERLKKADAAMAACDADLVELQMRLDEIDEWIAACG